MMTRQQSLHVCAAFAALALVVCSALGIWLAVANLPGITTPPLEIDHGNPTMTWLGQGVGAAYGLGFLLFVIIYAAKPWIPRFASSRWQAVGWYALLVACSLPYIWFLVVLDWQNPFVFPVSCWVYDPIAIWAVPTASFVYDLTRWTRISSGEYLARSLVEIIVIPIWLHIWIFASFFFLGGGWI
jgi:hypothetical protein